MSAFFSIPKTNLTKEEKEHIQELVIFRGVLDEIPVENRDALVAACDIQINSETRFLPEDQPMRVRFTHNAELIYGLTNYHAYLVMHHELRGGRKIWFPTAWLKDVIDIPDHPRCLLLPSKDDPDVLTCATGATKMARVARTMKQMSMTERRHMTQLDIYNFRIYAKTFKPECLHEYIADRVDAEIDLYDPRKPHEMSRVCQMMVGDIKKGKAPSLFIYITSYCVKLGSRTKELDIELVKHDCEFYRSLWLFFDAKGHVMRPSDCQSFTITYLPEPLVPRRITTFMKGFAPDDGMEVAKVD